MAIMSHMQDYLDASFIVAIRTEEVNGEQENIGRAIPKGARNPRNVYHKWIGDARDPEKQKLSDHILCVLMTEQDSLELPAPVNVTIVDTDVTCKPCLEWLHA